jgi:hypothetical protein
MDGRTINGSSPLAVVIVVLRPRVQAKGIRPESERVWIEAASL